MQQIKHSNVVSAAVWVTAGVWVWFLALELKYACIFLQQNTGEKIEQRTEYNFKSLTAD